MATHLGNPYDGQLSPNAMQKSIDEQKSKRILVDRGFIKTPQKSSSKTASNRAMDRSHEAGWKTWSIPCHSCSSSSQLPNHPQETEDFLCQNFWMDRRYGLDRIAKNSPVRPNCLIRGFLKSILQG
ncbi:MAG: hypothetical protein LBC45_00470 [Chlamydiales bacterium]|nr:hypothetical protein [Chlamydiales bacterium]